MPVKSKRYDNKNGENSSGYVLPDLLGINLKVLFCGTAVGNKSASERMYYARPNNKFWDVLFETGLTTVKLKPQQFRELLKYGIGLTDLAKNISGNDSDLLGSDYDVVGLKSKIDNYEPKILAFNGQEAAKIFFNVQAVEYGKQKKSYGETLLFVLPSTSGSANKYWDVKYWTEIACLTKE